MILLGVVIAGSLELFALPGWGAVSDRFGRRVVFGGGMLFLALYIFPFFWILDTGSPGSIWLALVVGLGLAHPAAYGVQASFFAELFGPRFRYSGISLAYQVSGLIAAAPLLIIATLLVDSAAGEPWLFALYLSLIGLISATCVYPGPETSGIDVDQDPALEKPVDELPREETRDG